LQQTAGAAEQAARTVRNVAATAQRLAAVGRFFAVIFSPPTWPIWIVIGIVVGIFLVILIVVIVICTATPDWVNPIGITRTIFEAVRSLLNAISGITCT
jgi:hypothetical protein